MPLETRGLLASYDKARSLLEVFGPTKVPHTNRALLARMLRMREADIRFIEPDVGGSFGARGEFYPEDFLIPLAGDAARAAGALDRGPARAFLRHQPLARMRPSR